MFHSRVFGHGAGVVMLSEDCASRLLLLVGNPIGQSFQAEETIVAITRNKLGLLHPVGA